MGSNYKQAVSPPAVGKALHAWHKDARKRVKIGALFSFGNNRNISTGEEESLTPKDSDSDSNSLSLPLGVIIEESSS